MLELAEDLIALGRVDEGIVRLEESLSIATGSGLTKISVEGHRRLAAVFEKVGDLARALEHERAAARSERETITAEARTIVGSYLGSAVPSRDIPRYAELWRAGRLPVEALISSHIALDEIDRAMDTLAEGLAIRIASGASRRPGAPCEELGRAARRPARVLFRHVHRRTAG